MSWTGSNQDIERERDKRDKVKLDFNLGIDQGKLIKKKTETEGEAKTETEKVKIGKSVQLAT